jgi:hypothetical protein
VVTVVVHLVRRGSGHATVMTFNQEILKVASAVSDTDVAIPANFKEKR